MRLSDVFNGSSGNSILPLIKNTTVMGVYEVGSAADVSKKLDEIKRTISKPSSSSYLVIVFK